MGLLLDTHTGQLVTLSVRTLIGRAPACQIALADPRASAEHAVVAWSGERWELRDLGSAGGTTLDGRPLPSGARAPLSKRARLAFAGGDDWILADDRGAGPASRDEVSGALVHSEIGILALPFADDPRATLFRRSDGRWFVEIGDEHRAIDDREALDLGGGCWRVYLPSELGPLPTMIHTGRTPLVLGDVQLVFSPGLDEAQVDVRIQTDDGNEYALPGRSCRDLLLALARARVEDARRGRAADEQGWIRASELADRLHYTAARLSLEIFRARGMFGKQGFTDAMQLIERRAPRGEIRIGVVRLDVPRA